MIIANPIYDVVFKYLLEDASEDMRNKRDVEDEIDRIFEREIAKVNAEKDLIIAEKDKEIEQERQENEELRKQIEELRKQVKD